MTEQRVESQGRKKPDRKTHTHTPLLNSDGQGLHQCLWRPWSIPAESCPFKLRTVPLYAISSDNKPCRKVRDVGDRMGGTCSLMWKESQVETTSVWQGPYLSSSPTYHQSQNCHSARATSVPEPPPCLPPYPSITRDWYHTDITSSVASPSAQGPYHPISDIATDLKRGNLGTISQSPGTWRSQASPP